MKVIEKKIVKASEEISNKVFDENGIEQYLICVECGGKATEGSAKHPYCKKCFTRVWKDNYIAYHKWLEEIHR